TEAERGLCAGTEPEMRRLGEDQSAACHYAERLAVVWPRPPRGGPPMKAPFTGVRLAVAALIALFQAGCGAPGAGVGAGPRPGRGDDTVKAADLNLRPRDQVKEGGTLRWGIGEFPAQWNRNHIDGNLASAAVISDALLPSAFLSDGKARLSAD